MEASRKRLLYLSQRRGMRELDLILGPFATAMLPKFSETETATYAALLTDYPEVKLYDWLVRKLPLEETTPPEIKVMVTRILEDACSAHFQTSFLA